jgi:hypothetical protein
MFLVTIRHLGPYARVKPIKNNARVEIIAAMYSLNISLETDRVAAIRITAIQIRTIVANTDAYFITYIITPPLNNGVAFRGGLGYNHAVGC